MDAHADTIVALNLVAIVGLLLFSNLRPWMIFLGSSGILFLCNILPLETLTQGFTNSSLIVLVMLYFISIPMERTSIMRRMTQFVSSGSASGSILKLGIFSATFSAFVNNTAVVAALLGPVKKQQKIASSKLLLPLSYASILGGTLTLIGTSTNLIVNGFVQQAGMPSLGFFEFTAIGLPVTVVCLGLMVLFGARLLPERRTQDSGATQEYFLERRIASNSPLVGRSVQDNGLRQLEKIFLVEVIRDHQVYAPVSPQEILKAGDTLVFTGDIHAIDLLDEFQGLESLDLLDEQVRDNLVEVVVSPSASLVGRTIKEVDFRARFDAAVVAVRRGDQRIGGGLGRLELQAGDALVLAVGDDFNRRREIAPEFIVLGGVETNRLIVPIKEWSIYAGFALVIILGATGIFPLIKGLAILLLGLMALKVISREDLKARFPFQLVIVIGSALGISRAMFETGLAADISLYAGTVFSGLPPIGALIGIFLLTWLFTELVTNNAAAAIMFPLAMAISDQWGDNPMPFIMAVAFGASASFLSPYGYQTNLMVYTAGNYRIGDYIKLGLPVLCAYVVVSLTMISIVYDV